VVPIENELRPNTLIEFGLVESERKRERERERERERCISVEEGLPVFHLPSIF
jgi:hypothetical protein